MAMESIQIRVDHNDLNWLDEESQKMASSRGAVIRSLIRARQDIPVKPVEEANYKLR